MNTLGRLRLLPVLIFAAVLLLSVKVSDIWTRLNVASDTVAVEETRAQQQAPEPGGDQGGGDQGGGNQDNQDGGGGGNGGGPGLVSETGPETPRPGKADPTLFTQSEIDLLQKLAARRKELEKRENELKMRKELLSAAEKRIDKKVARLKALKKEIEGLLEEYDQQEKAQIQRLVNIYGNMDPDKAAAIFEDMDMKTLMKVVSSMKERTVADILQAMKPAKARAVTQKLAERKDLPDIGQGGGAG